MAYRYPPNIGIGQVNRAEKVVTRDIIFALAKGLVSSIVFTRSTRRIAVIATYLALSSTLDKTAKFKLPLGASMRVTSPKMPHT